jgi:hypothetical protein
MRIATWNVQWFDSLFDDTGDVLRGDGPSGRPDVGREERVAALRLVLARIDADALLVVEAPDRQPGRRDGTRALARFAEGAGIRATRVVTGFDSDTQQELALLHDPTRLLARFDPQEPHRFDGTFELDLNHDGRPEPVIWSRPPLEVAARTAGGTDLRLIGVHAKSKHPSGARDAAHAVRIAIENRRKQLAQCVWLRSRVDRHLLAGESLIVLGDFNDGPGLDEYEELFGRSGLEIVLGEGEAQRLFDPSARLVTQGRGAAPASARFRQGPDGPWLSAMLDYILVSPDLCARGPRWRIWHPFDDPACWRDEAMRRALLLASDHFPVTLDIDL